jgi:hypothetical protein
LGGRFLLYAGVGEIAWNGNQFGAFFVTPDLLLGLVAATSWLLQIQKHIFVLLLKFC